MAPSPTPTATRTASPPATPTAEAVTAAAPKPLFTRADRRSFDALARQLGGRSGLAVATLGEASRTQRLGPLRSGVAWSTIKVPIAMAVVAADQAGDGAALRAAITRSDNAAAAQLWKALGSATRAARATDAQLRAAGDAVTVTEHRLLRSEYSPYGQTAWPLVAQARFAAGLPCRPAGRRILTLMRQIDPSQRWGIGAAGAPVAFKGGWGPGVRPGAAGGYLARQFGVVTVRGRRIGFSIAAAPGDASHATATANLTRIGRWLVANVDPGGKPSC